MAALHTASDSPATQPEPAEDGSECDADPEEEEEEEEEGREEEEVVVEEVATQVQEVAEAEVEANSVDIGDGDDDDDYVEEVLAEEQTLSLGTQERLSNGGDAKSSGLQGKGKNGDPAAAVETARLSHEGGTGPGSEVWEDPGAPPCLPARYHWL